MRHWLPNHIGSVFWFGVDDTTFSVRVPFYSFAEVPKALKSAGTDGKAGGAGAIDKFSFESLFWLNNLVANRVYYQWDTLEPVVTKELNKMEDDFLGVQKEIEETVGFV